MLIKFENLEKGDRPLQNCIFLFLLKIRNLVIFIQESMFYENIRKNFLLKKGGEEKKRERGKRK